MANPSYAVADSLPTSDSNGHRIGSCEEATCSCISFRVYSTAGGTRGFIRERSLGEAEAYIKTQLGLVRYLDPHGSNPNEFGSPEIVCEVADSGGSLELTFGSANHSMGELKATLDNAKHALGVLRDLILQNPRNTEAWAKNEFWQSELNGYVELLKVARLRADKIRAILEQSNGRMTETTQDMLRLDKLQASRADVGIVSLRSQFEGAIHTAHPNSGSVTASPTPSPSP